MSSCIICSNGVCNVTNKTCTRENKEDIESCDVYRMNKRKYAISQKEQTNYNNECENMDEINPKYSENKVSEFEQFINDTPELKELFNKWKIENNKPKVLKASLDYSKNNSENLFVYDCEINDYVDYNTENILGKAFMAGAMYVKDNICNMNSSNEILNWLFKECRTIENES